LTRQETGAWHRSGSEDDACGIRDKIRLSRQLYLRFRDELGSDSELSALFREYEGAVAASWQAMEETGIPEICLRCATVDPGPPKGGCCGRGVDDWYDPYLLLMNLLMGVDLADERTYPDCCIFLGSSGCTLKARFHFCVNYLCSRITDRLGPKALADLRACYGRELYLSWLIETRLRQFIPGSAVKC